MRIDIQSECIRPVEALKQNADTNQYPKYQKEKPHLRKLAVVGGGPLVVNNLDELKAWDGDIWGINFTANWLHHHGIKCTFITVDPSEFTTDVLPKDALVASCCDPTLFKYLEGKNFKVFDLIETHEDGIIGGTSTATRTPSLAINLGYMDVSYFGCEGSYSDITHIDRHVDQQYQLIVRADGKDYRTELSFILQCEEFITYFTNYGWIYKNRSHGLLEAMLKDPEWKVVAVSNAMKQYLINKNGEQGLYGKPYRGAA